MNWVVLRRQLQLIREEAGFSDAELARAIKKRDAASKLHKSSIGRIEDVERRPTHNPSLPTIEAWAAACGLELPDFFARVKRHGHGEVFTTAQHDTTPSIYNSSPESHSPRAEARSNVDHSIRPADFIALTEGLAGVTAAITLAANAIRDSARAVPRNRQSAPDSDPPAKRRRANGSR